MVFMTCGNREKEKVKEQKDKYMQHRERIKKNERGFEV